MGGDPVTTEPLVLKVDEEVRDILEKVGLLAFFKKYGITRESFPKPWDRVVIQVMKYLTLEAKEKDGALRELKWGFPRSSGTLVSRAQLHLGVAPMGKESPNSNSRVKLEEKHKIVDFVDTLEEDKDGIDDDKDVESSKGVKESVPKSLPKRGSLMEPQGNFTILE
eukprot:Gb_02600 [translate_table: standard]